MHSTSQKREYKMLPNFYSNDTRKGFHWPGRIVHGAGCIAMLESILRQSDNILFVIDVALSLDKFQTIQYKEIYRVSGEPNSNARAELIALTIHKKFDIVIAIGGGSTIDLAKMITDHIRHPDGFIQDREQNNTSPQLIAIPTLNGSGSETSRFFIVSNEHNCKVSYRAWSNVPNLSLIDPNLIISAGRDRIIMGAFDNFVHLWETLICKYERNQLTSMSACMHIPELIETVHKISNSKTIEIDDVEKLALSSAAGGISISNVRTGLIHTLGESLSAQTSLPHPLTLLVFFRSVMKSYQNEVNECWLELKQNLDVKTTFNKDWQFDDLINFWIYTLSTLNCAELIKKNMKLNVDENLILNSVKNDTVLVKENPGVMSTSSILTIIRESISDI